MPDQSPQESSHAPLPDFDSTLGRREASSPVISDLRKQVLFHRAQDVVKRIASNPEPDDEEIAATVYREEIEEQCRAAIFAIRRKGHQTYSSGFARGDIQIVDGRFELDRSTIDLLLANGFLVFGDVNHANTLAFETPRADLPEITGKWNELAELLPDKGEPAPPLLDFKREKFLAEFERKKFSYEVPQVYLK